MTNDPSADSADDDSDSDDGFDGIEITPEQAENMRRALAQLVPKLDFPVFTMSESMKKTLLSAAGVFEAQALAYERMAPALGDIAIQAASIAQASFDRIAGNIDFSGIAASIAETFAWQQSALFKNLGPAIAAMQGGFYPPNLRSITDLEFNAVNEVVMTDGIALYGLPRAATAEALLRAENARERRDILGRRWKTISADCREVVLGCTSEAVAQYVPFAQAALDALDAGHAAAAQALAGSLIDAIVTNYFGSDRYRYTPNKKTPTSAAYDEFTVREFVAFAPMWQAYQQFYVGNGDKIPATFSRNATAHTVSRRQFSRRNAVQGLMFVCSLLYLINEESSASASRE